MHCWSVFRQQLLFIAWQYACVMFSLRLVLVKLPPIPCWVGYKKAKHPPEPSSIKQQIVECISKTHSIHFNPFWGNHVFVFIAIYGKWFDSILILNSETLRNDDYNIKRNKPNDKTKWIPWKPASFPKLTQSRFVPIQIHGQSELNWVSFWKTVRFSR